MDNKIIGVGERYSKKEQWQQFKKRLADMQYHPSNDTIPYFQMVCRQLCSILREGISGTTLYGEVKDFYSTFCLTADGRDICGTAAARDAAKQIMAIAYPLQEGRQERVDGQKAEDEGIPVKQVRDRRYWANRNAKPKDLNWWDKEYKSSIIDLV